MSGRSKHTPVLQNELIELLQPKKNHNYIDATYGGGGIAKEVLRANAPDGQLIAFDIDHKAVERAERELSLYGERVIIINDNFRTLKTHVESSTVKSIDGVYADLGVSSDQLADAERGISFTFVDAPLDMRMGKNGVTAADLVNAAREEDLETIIRCYGDEPRSKEIASRIVRVRRKKHFKTVGDLLHVIETVYKNKRGRIHPATKVWQALRIAVNDELDSLRVFLPQAFEVLAPGGRLVLVSFHSLEDRIVKRAFKSLTKEGRAERLTKKVVRPTAEEVYRNPRSRSAKLRGIKKIK